MLQPTVKKVICDKIVNIKVTELDKATWNLIASSENKTLSQWIKDLCNSQMYLGENNND